MKDVDSYIPLFCVCAAEKKKNGEEGPFISCCCTFFGFHSCFFFLPFIHVFFRPV